MNKKFAAICACMLMCAIIALFLGSFAFSPASNISIAGEIPKTIYLTFDDGPSDRVTPKILDVLKTENVKATFFIIGKNAERRKYIIKREIDEGHAVGVHSYSHIYREIYASPENLIEDIDKCNAIIEEIAGKPSNIYRFPGGSFNLSKELLDAVNEKGLKSIDWNASFRDSEIYGASPEQLLNAATSTLAYPQNVIMLAHDSTDKIATAEALRGVIRYFKKSGYLFEKF